MKKPELIGVIVAIAIGIWGSTVHAQDTHAGTVDTAIVVGTFDSRAVATAYMRSDKFKEIIRELKLERMEAKEAGDEERAAELEAQGSEMQRHAHLQVFGNAPISNVLKVIEGELAGVAAKAGADVMVSKWRLAYAGPKANFVDVTDQLVMLFEPDEETLNVIAQIKDTDPIPAEQLKKHDQ